VTGWAFEIVFDGYGVVPVLNPVRMSHYDTFFACSGVAAGQHGFVTPAGVARDTRLKVIVGAVLLGKNDYKLH